MRTALLAAVLFAGLLSCAYSAPGKEATLQEIQDVLMQTETQQTESQPTLLCKVLGERRVDTDTGNGARAQWLHIHFHWQQQRENVRQQDQAVLVNLSCTPVNISPNGDVELVPPQ